ncbi:class I SAM-dependent methyltransferase [Nioella aestuarii]|uniref:class I SAM-dependent methyltransferase n=1 Tax=Nioella aestuarii TaxID=1662864 RepID=UPI003D7F9677
MVDDKTLKTYTQKAADYAALEFSESERQALTDFLSLIPKGGAIFDLGCGPGLHAARMVAEGFAVSAIDATPAFVKTAREKGVNARLGSFDDLAETAAYDGIWASFSLLHAPKADFPRHLSAIHRALRPSGTLYLGLKLGAGERRDSLGRFYAYYEEPELHDLLSQAGFSGIRSTSGEGSGLAGTIDRFILLTATRA